MKGLRVEPFFIFTKVVIGMINDIYEQDGKAYRVTQENPMMGVEYGYDGAAFKSIGEPICIDSMHRITLSIVKIRHWLEPNKSNDPTKAEIMSKLDDKGITYNARASKADLLKLLEG